MCTRPANVQSARNQALPPTARRRHPLAVECAQLTYLTSRKMDL
ncbi:hypothetical protein BN135_2062 [Cronobacter muytjensii 530]